jgi:hypothetical protein
MPPAELFEPVDPPASEAPALTDGGAAAARAAEDFDAPDGTAARTGPAADWVGDALEADFDPCPHWDASTANRHSPRTPSGAFRHLPRARVATASPVATFAGPTRDSPLAFDTSRMTAPAGGWFRRAGTFFP